jgi:HlyD family secretion protein
MKDRNDMSPPSAAGPHTPEPVAADVDLRVQELFGDAGTRRPRRRRRLAAVAATVVLVSGLVVSSVAGGEPAAELRTATAQERDVADELTSVATMEPVSGAAVAFPAAGTVATVDVEVGESVSVGQELASLDEAELTRTLHAREEELARAELALSQALAGEDVEPPTGAQISTPASVTASTATTASASATTTASASEATTASASAGSTVVLTATVADDTELASLQQAVLAAQRTVDAALVESRTAIEAADAVCEALGAGSAGTAAAASSTTSTTVAGVSDADDLVACRGALEVVQDAQAAVATAQEQLAAAATALDDHLAQLAADQDRAAGGDGAAVGGSGSGTGGSAGSTGASGSVGSAATTSSSPSAADLIAYQAAVDAAQLQVLVAGQALAQATIVAPIAGTVVAVGIEAGDSVSAASATQQVRIQGADGIEVVTTVALADVASVRVGQAATVLADGSDDELAGEVVAVAPVPDTDTTSYRVTIGLEDPEPALASGTTGTVSIVTAASSAALAVPSSAVHTDQRGSSVTVLRDGATEQQRVEVGVGAGDWIEIASGLSEGDVVVLADLAEPLPTSATEATGSTGAGGGAGGPQLPGGAGGFPAGPGG